MKFDPHSLALTVGFATFVAVTGIVPALLADKPRSIQFGVRTVPVEAEDAAKLDAILKTPGVSKLASGTITDSLSLASAVAAAQGEGEALVRAQHALMRNDFRRAEAIANALVDKADQEHARAKDPAQKRRLATLRDQALLLKANAAMQTGRPRAAHSALDAVSQATPVNDFVVYLSAENLEAIGEFTKAARLFDKVAKMDNTPLEHRAVVRHAHNLFAAENWKDAAAALSKVIDRYPEYPRRYVALYERAIALDRLGKLQDAADAYQATWFEFPYKENGRKSKARLAELERQAVVPSDLPNARERFKRYRELRINKHWDLARTLFTELKQDYATEDGTSEFEHECEFQLAMNAHVQRKFDEARQRLESLARDYDAGKRAGISRYLTFKYLSQTYATLGRFDDALGALDRMSEGYGSRGKMKARAEFFEDHGRYDKALALYEQLYSPGRKRGWHYTWLLYKNAKFEQAYENFSRLAERSRGTNRAKYLYWAGRTLERAGKAREAAEIFTDIADSYSLDYYALQARNRLLDIEQRVSVAGQLIANAEGIANSADEVLDALEEAEANADQFVYPLDDPRSHQRHALWGSDKAPTSLTAGKACAPGEEPRPGVCTADVTAEIASKASGKASRTTTASPSSLASSVSWKEDASDETIENDDPETTNAEVIGAVGEAKVPTTKVRFDHQVPRIDYSTQARIYWNGRLGSATAFARAREGAIVGPVPSDLTAYDEPSYEGGLERAASQFGELFPQLERAHWLYVTGFEKGARWAARDVAIEYRELSKRWRARNKPHELDEKRWSYFIDNRRRGRSEFWGMKSDELRFPIGKSASDRKAALARQQAIHDQRDQIRPALVDALKEAGDHYMVRKFALATKGWYRENPRGNTRPLWMEAYPRAFPRLIMENAQRYGVNPYLLWALMTVESSFNPDSLSTADALGLLQVIPRTGLKTAILLGDEQFGPQDLLEEEIAIQHGAFYISQLIRKFRGQELFAIAGYNGGPHRVGDWLEMRGDTMPMDEFVEEIPFNQARLYVKKVLRFLSLYLKIYEKTDTLYVGQNIRDDYRPDPNF